MSDKPNIFQRINSVRKEVEYVKKDKAVSGGGANYKAVTHDQVISVIRASLVKHGVVIYPDQLKGDIVQMRDLDKQIKMHLYSGDYAVHFVNEDNPADRVSMTINAHANDNGDKAPGKCVTYAVKTAILKMFSLETGEDDESRAEPNKPVTTVQASAIRKGLGNDDERIAKFCAAYGIESVEDMPKAHYDRAMSQIKRSNEAK